MARKFVEGGASNVIVHTKRETKNIPCQQCGNMVLITIPYSGDILCVECRKSVSYSQQIESV